ncbi:PPIC-type PPIASE domain-containing protein [Malonomonas rubra DSM 5091]|uniref:Periplasmic chaperone PpiD n=1 Tax=Malonomonas rubra DSM 5091 TaxID=1122189 RepID=A0A1M6HYH7_MALRU|nr:peptidylprolyl isomerase [Malonomonas rubra]SHJ27309.1 PPIC-type PPIASE domain-containing protein [Malonomonas rubra DSM 5091]
MKLMQQLTALCFVTMLLCTSSLAFGPAGQAPAGKPPALGDDLAVELKVPLFADEFADLPVASAGGILVALKEVTPKLEKNSSFLLWESATSGADLTVQFNQALSARLQELTTEPNLVVQFTRGQIDDQQRLAIDVPLFSEPFAAVPVATIDGVPITVDEFSDDLQAVHSEASGNHAHTGMRDNIQKLMERLITVRLVELEARNIGFDQTPSFQKQVANHAQKTLLYGLLNLQAASVVLDEAAVDDLYRQISLEGKLESYRFSNDADAKLLLQKVNNGEQFDNLIAAAVKAGKAVGGEEQDFTRFKDLLPNIAKAASNMEIGEISEIFRQADGFILFRLIDRRFVDDPQALQFARNNVWDTQRARAGTEYINQLIDQYASFNQDAQEVLDFAAIKQTDPDIKLSGALAPLLKDQRALATVSGGDPGQVMVAEVAKRIEETFFHGTDVILKPAEVDQTKDEIIQDMLFRMAGTLEAKKQGLDQQAGYLNEVEEFERRTLFDIFMQKVITPDVRFTEEKVRAYYQEHLEEYQTPAMLKLQSLPFYQQKDAEDAAEKLRKGSDFKWVSANSEGLVDVQDKDLLQFDQKILSLTALPQTLQSQAAAAQRGDTLVHAEPNNFYYVLYFENVYPPQPKPYDQVREEILKIVYQQEVESTLGQWVEKLKEAYPTEIYLVGQGG